MTSLWNSTSTHRISACLSLPILGVNTWNMNSIYRKGTIIRQAPVFRHLEHYGKAHGSLLSGWMNYNYIACCWFPTSSNIFILPSQFWQISYESYWLHCSKCRILVLLRYFPKLPPEILPQSREMCARQNDMNQNTTKTCSSSDLGQFLKQIE